MMSVTHRPGRPVPRMSPLGVSGRAETGLALFRKSLSCTSSLQSYFVKTPPAGRSAEAAAPPLRAPVPATETLDAVLVASKDAMEAERDAWRTETLTRWKSLRPRGSRIFGATSIVFCAHWSDQPSCCV